MPVFTYLFDGYLWKYAVVLVSALAFTGRAASVKRQ